MTKRDNSLDVLRGILLVMITINHIGGPLCVLTFQPMSFVSAAEGFVFLSGYILCLVYGKRLIRGQCVTFPTLYKRSLKIYWYHLTLLLILLIPYFINVPFLKQWQFNGLATFAEKPQKALFAYALLLFQPEHLDILPLYILFIPIGFLALKAFVNQKTTLILSL
ncbi:MAG: OpgC domain-containing protein, partial [Dyadobacter sp.]